MMHRRPLEVLSTTTLLCVIFVALVAYLFDVCHGQQQQQHQPPSIVGEWDLQQAAETIKEKIRQRQVEDAMNAYASVVLGQQQQAGGDDHAATEQHVTIMSMETSNKPLQHVVADPPAVGAEGNGESQGNDDTRDDDGTDRMDSDILPEEDEMEGDNNDIDDIEGANNGMTLSKDEPTAVARDKTTKDSLLFETSEENNQDVNVHMDDVGQKSPSASGSDERKGESSTNAVADEDKPSELLQEPTSDLLLESNDETEGTLSLPTAYSDQQQQRESMMEQMHHLSQTEGTNSTLANDDDSEKDAVTISGNKETIDRGIATVSAHQQEHLSLAPQVDREIPDDTDDRVPPKDNNSNNNTSSESTDRVHNQTKESDARTSDHNDDDDDNDDRSHLDVWAAAAKTYLTQQVIPPTDAMCRWDWRVLQCAPSCHCTMTWRRGDYHLGRACRRRRRTLNDDDTTTRTSEWCEPQRTPWERPIPKRILSLVQQTAGILRHKVQRTAGSIWHTSRQPFRFVHERFLCPHNNDPCSPTTAAFPWLCGGGGEWDGTADSCPRVVAKTGDRSSRRQVRYDDKEDENEPQHLSSLATFWKERRESLLEDSSWEL